MIEQDLIVRMCVNVDRYALFVLYTHKYITKHMHTPTYLQTPREFLGGLSECFFGPCTRLFRLEQGRAQAGVGHRGLGVYVFCVSV